MPERTRTPTRYLVRALIWPAAFLALAAAGTGAAAALTITLRGHPAALTAAIAAAATLVAASRRFASVERELLDGLSGSRQAASDLANGVYAPRPPEARIRELHELNEALSTVGQHMEAQVAELAAQAFHDPLTKLPNRALFADRLERMLVRLKRRKGTVAVLFLDLDNFKLINDSFGHDVGDQLLIAVGRRLQAGTRAEDTVARFGGDEFAIAAGDVRQTADAVRIASRVADQLAAPFMLEGQEVFVTSSIGIALNRSEHDRPELLLRDADTAMYRAKANGKAKYELFSQEMQHQTSERLRLEMDLRRAMERGELQVHYQPVVDLLSRRIVEVEALVRWYHPQRGPVSPADFIPVAEDSGLIGRVGRWVLVQACTQARLWREELGAAAPPKVSVNLSSRQISPGLARDVRQVLEETGLSPAGLKLEITEGTLMRGEAATFAILFELNALKIDLALDDFGVGYSSLAYLKRFPFSSLKIDRSFVQRIGRDPEDAAIVRAIVTIAKPLHMDVVGEGVETAEQVEHLLALGCNRGQGYFFARPAGGEAITQLLRSAPKARDRSAPRAPDEAGAGQ
jgi:diguanylate cyclase (GGDEF)-like protein